MKPGIIICSRSDSSRLPGKPFLRIGNKRTICHLAYAACNSGIPTFVAVPYDEYDKYVEVLDSEIKKYGLKVFAGSRNDPLKRKLDCAREFGIDTVIRVTHDKVLLDYNQIREFLDVYKEKRLDYIYSTNFIDGMSFEIFDIMALKKASLAFKDVEHISFAIDAVAKNKLNLKMFKYCRNWLRRKTGNEKLRLLLDYENDYIYLRNLAIELGSEFCIEKIIDSKTERTNLLPQISVYTCSYNDHEYLEETIKSVLSQDIDDYEYILIDDGSTDIRVTEIMERYAVEHENIRFIRNRANIGLASSSNIAVKESLGKYVVRIDSDDYFLRYDSVSKMIKDMIRFDCDVIYPDNIKGEDVQKGYEDNHVGGALFRKRALDYIRFTDSLRHFDGADIFKRFIEKKIRISYHHNTVFYYRQRPDSLSKSQSEDRADIKSRLSLGFKGDELLTGSVKA